MQTKIYLPKSPFFKNLLNGASGQVLMLVPGLNWDSKMMSQFNVEFSVFFPVFSFRFGDILEGKLVNKNVP